MEMSKFQETWITFNLSCFAESCNVVFAAELQKCIVDRKTCADLPSARG